MVSEKSTFLSRRDKIDKTSILLALGRLARQTLLIIVIFSKKLEIIGFIKCQIGSLPRITLCNLVSAVRDPSIFLKISGELIFFLNIYRNLLDFPEITYNLT